MKSEKHIYTSEIFSSIQGEGLHIGVPSTFVRLFGCNFTCSGFSNKDKIKEPLIDLTDITDVNQLDGDNFTVGCDSRYSWDKKFKHLQKKVTVKGLVKLISSHLSDEDIVPSFDMTHIIWTGGEPLLHQKFLMEVIPNLTYKHMTFETNCSIPLRPEFITFLTHWLEQDRSRTVLFSNSPKLTHSGEPADRRICPEAAATQRQVAANISQFGSCDSVKQTFKYVLSDEDQQFKEAMEIHQVLLGVIDWETALRMNMPLAMPLGATYEQYRKYATGVAHLCLYHGFRFCPRTHLELFGNQIGT